MARPRSTKAIAVCLIVLGALTCSLAVIAAFTPVGLVAVPVGVMLIALGANRASRTGSHAPPEPLSWAVLTETSGEPASDGRRPE
ncbi:MAG TPA: hypothetical protein VHW74_02765 [Mycobacteriales bacterium]|nr:hypothetical protein [Mycobacteriales bacterium]